ncbi:sensor histidine kinase [Blautia sp. Sow4_E7]|uniref:sensor histidine kinase n=1 Tax=Blautia sp. Sow4_E7 TaxID=3438749 RepID=UPI003F937B3B
MKIILGLCCVLMHLPTLLLRYVPFKEKVSKKEKKSLMFWYGAGMILDFVLCLWIIENGRMTITFYKFNILFYCVIMGIVNILVIKGYIKVHLFCFGLTALIVWITFAVAVFITDKIGYNMLEYGMIMETVIGFALFSIGYYWYRSLMRRTITPFLNIECRDYWNNIWFIPMAMFFSGLFSHGLEEYTATVNQLVCRLLVGVATIILCHRVAQDYGNMQEKNQMNKQIEMQKGYYKSLTESVEMEREVRHNFKHQLTALKGFMDTGNREELQKYCEILQNALLNVGEVPYTGNAAADSVLYHYACVAKEKKISFKVCGKLDNLSISDTDLCCLLGNALDNAVTACDTCDKERYITILSEREQNILLLTIDNSFDGIVLKKENKILSRKRENEEGIGIRSMRQICEKYDGISRFEADGKKFEASFMLHI